MSEFNSCLNDRNNSPSSDGNVGKSARKMEFNMEILDTEFVKFLLHLDKRKFTSRGNYFLESRLTVDFKHNNNRLENFKLN